LPKSDMDDWFRQLIGTSPPFAAVDLDSSSVVDLIWDSPSSQTDWDSPASELTVIDSDSANFKNEAFSSPTSYIDDEAPMPMGLPSVLSGYCDDPFASLLMSHLDSYATVSYHDPLWPKDMSLPVLDGSDGLDHLNLLHPLSYLSSPELSAELMSFPQIESPATPDVQPPSLAVSPFVNGVNNLVVGLSAPSDFNSDFTTMPFRPDVGSLADVDITCSQSNPMIAEHKKLTMVDNF